MRFALPEEPPVPLVPDDADDEVPDEGPDDDDELDWDWLLDDDVPAPVPELPHAASAAAATNATAMLPSCRVRVILRITSPS